MRRIIKPLMCVGLTVVLVSCTMAPRYERPESPVAEQLSRLETEYAGAGQDVSVNGAIGWREFYRDAQLQGLLEKALENNRDLRLAALNVEQLQAQYRIERAGLFPDLDLNASSIRQQVPASLSLTGAETITAQYSVGLGVAAYELDLFGRVRSLQASALEAYLSTVEARKSAQLSLVAQVSDAYYTWASNRTLLDLSEDSLARQQQSHAMVQRRYNQGLASELDLSQAVSSVHAARVDRALYQRQMAQSYTALELLIGASLDKTQLQKSLRIDEEELASLPATLNSRALLQRPDILQAEHQLKAANADIGAARAAFFPRIALTANGGTASPALSGLFDSGSGTWSFTPQLSLPIFTWGANKANLDVARLRRDADVARYEKAIRAAFKETLDSLQALDTLSEQVQAQRDLVAASAHSLELAELRYEKGVDSFLEVLVSQRNYNSARQALVTTHLAQLRNRITLFKALGGGAQAPATASL
jgi:multidrug efflux system outer membrane protein